jgi:hypothetical protein
VPGSRGVAFQLPSIGSSNSGAQRAWPG